MCVGGSGASSCACFDASRADATVPRISSSRWKSSMLGSRDASLFMSRASGLIAEPALSFSGSSARRPRCPLSAPLRTIVSRMWCASSAKSSSPPSCSPRSTFAGATLRWVVASREQHGEDAEDVVVFSKSSSLRPLAGARSAAAVGMPPSGVDPRRAASSRVRASRAVAIAILLPSRCQCSRGECPSNALRV